jgi:Ala-tRNA(Pro) deacylase
MKIETFLQDKSVPFEMLPHRTEFGASRIAHALHVPGENFAKTVLLNVDGKLKLAVISASHSVNMETAKHSLVADHVELAPETELAKTFPDCELGAVPPFGSQYGVETIVDDPLTEDEHIVFEGNTHNQAVYMRYVDFEQIEHPRVAHLTGRE